MAENYDNDDYDLPSAPIGHLEPPAPGYTLATGGASQKDLRCGYVDLEGELDLNDVFGAFDTANYGLVGGACTVDDFTPEGIMDRPARGGQVPQDRLHNETFGGALGRSDPGKRYP